MYIILCHSLPLRVACGRQALPRHRYLVKRYRKQIHDSQASPPQEQLPEAQRQRQHLTMTQSRTRLGQCPTTDRETRHDTHRVCAQDTP